MARLTNTQREVLRLMADGWELCHSGGISPTISIQEGGAGKGGRSRSVRSDTWGGLLGRGLLIKAGRGPGLGTVYKLTDTGKIEAAR